jgi:transcriptional regulator with XRE-family HTH domain
MVLTERGIKQVELARLIGIDRSTLSLYVNGWKEPSEHIKEEIARVLGLDPVQLFDGGRGDSTPNAGEQRTCGRAGS